MLSKDCAGVDGNEVMVVLALTLPHEVPPEVLSKVCSGVSYVLRATVQKHNGCLP